MLDASRCVVPVDLSETFDLKALNFILFWKNWHKSASWILWLPWLLCESNIPRFSNASQWHHFHLLLDSIIRHQYTKVQLDAVGVFLYSSTSHRYSLHQAFQNTFFFFPPSMFYQAVLEECTALLNIIVSPERAKATSPSLCNVLGKPIRFIAQNIFPFVLQRSQTPAVSLSQRSLFLSLCFECVHTWLLCSYISWKRVCNQGVCGAKLSIDYFWIQL